MGNNSYVKVDRQLSHAHILRDNFMNVNSTLEKIRVVCYGMSFEDISTWLNELDSIARPPSDAMSSTNNGTKCQSNYLKLQHHFLSYLDSVERFCKHFNGDRIGICFVWKTKTHLNVSTHNLQSMCVLMSVMIEITVDIVYKVFDLHDFH